MTDEILLFVFLFLEAFLSILLRAQVPGYGQHRATVGCRLHLQNNHHVHVYSPLFTQAHALGVNEAAATPKCRRREKRLSGFDV